MTVVQRRRVWALNCVLATAACLVTLVPESRPLSGATPARWLLVPLVLAVAICERMTVSFVFRSDSHTFSFVDIPTTVAIAVFGPRASVLAIAVGLSIMLAVQRHPRVRFAYNVGAGSLTAALAFVVAAAIVPHHPTVQALWLGAAGAVVLCCPVSTLLVVAVRSLAAGHYQGEGLARMLMFGLFTALSSAAFAALVGVVWTVSPAIAALSVFPILFLYGALRLYMSERLERGNVEFLYEATRVLEEADVLETGLAEVLDRARRVFRTEYAEVAIRRRDGEWLRIHAGNGARPTGSGFLATGLGRHVHGDVRVLTRRHDGDDALLVGLNANDAMVSSFEMQGGDAVGILVVADRVGTPVVFDRAAQKQFGAFRAQIAVSLENGELEQSLDRLTRVGEHLHHQANHDPLTGLANRSGLQTHVAQMHGRVTVLMLDLDDFKPINDTLGHEAGDRVLVYVASVLCTAVGGSGPVAEDALVARLGGDEFAIVLSDGPDGDASLEEAWQVAERIVDGLRAPMLVSGARVTVNASIGIARTGADLNAMLRNADAAMYESKRRGKGRISQHGTVTRAQDLSVG